MSTNKKLYVAYGTNMNARDMSYRCPNAAKLGVGYIKDYKLEFAEGIDTKPLFRAMGKKGWGKDYVAAFHNRVKNT